MSGQSVMDRMQAARHSVLGSQIGKKVCKATTEEIMAPKRKHLEDLLQYTHDPNVNVTDIIDQLLSRTHNQNWVVVYKSLISLHHLMCYGHEKVIQNMASRTMELNLANYYDRKDMQGAQMSPFIQRYSKYLSAKAGSYRAIAFDFCNIKRGKEEGKLRVMDAGELLMALPTLSDQLEALLQFQNVRKDARLTYARPSDLTNGVVVASFMLLFRDCLRLFASYNEGVINLLEKFFDMSSKKQCEHALAAYKTFLQQMENVKQFLKVAEEYGVDKGDIPDLTSAPNSLLEALESHYQSLETDKKTGQTKKAVSQKPVGISKQLSVNAEAFAAVTSKKHQSNNPFFFDETESSPTSNIGISEADKLKALEEEKAELNRYNSQLKSNNPFSNDSASNPNTNATSSSSTVVLDPFDGFLGDLSDSSKTTSPSGLNAVAFGTPTPSPIHNNSNAASITNNDPFAPSYSTQNTVDASRNAAAFDPFGTNSNTGLQSQYSNPFLQNNSVAVSGAPSQSAMYSATVSGSLWGATNGFPQQSNSSQQQTVNFDAAFGTNSSASTYGGANVFGDVLQPTPVGGFGGQTSSGGNMAALNNSTGNLNNNMSKNTTKGTSAPGLGKDLDSALANLATSLTTKSPSHRPTAQSQHPTSAW